MSIHSSTAPMPYFAIYCNENAHGFSLGNDWNKYLLYFFTGWKVCYEAKGRIEEASQSNGEEEPGIDKNRGVIRWRKDWENTVSNLIEHWISRSKLKNIFRSDFYDRILVPYNELHWIKFIKDTGEAVA